MDATDEVQMGGNTGGRGVEMGRPGYAADQPEVMNLAQAAELLQLHPVTLRQYATDGLVPARKVGRGRGTWRFSKAELMVWVTGRDLEPVGPEE